MSTPPALHGIGSTEGGLNPAFLIASTIQGNGCIVLQAVFDGKPDPELRAEFSLGPAGDFMQRCIQAGTDAQGTPVPLAGVYGKEPLDMRFLAECLTHALGALTPALFRVSALARGGRRRLEEEGSLADRRRLRLLHEAFNLYLLAYEERLV